MIKYIWKMLKKSSYFEKKIFLLNQKALIIKNYLISTIFFSLNYYFLLISYLYHQTLCGCVWCVSFVSCWTYREQKEIQLICVWPIPNIPRSVILIATIGTRTFCRLNAALCRSCKYLIRYTSTLVLRLCFS